MRITIRVMNVKDGSAVWTYKCDQVCNDVFALQDSISEDVAKALMLTVTPEEKRLLAKRYTDNKEAYELYLKGRFHYNQTYENPDHPITTNNTSNLGDCSTTFS